MPADLNDYFNKKNGNSNNNGNNNRQNFNFKAPEFNFKGFGKFSRSIHGVIIIILFLIVAKPFIVIFRYIDNPARLPYHRIRNNICLMVDHIGRWFIWKQIPPAL